ncbi:MAG TPA: hypothetical protein PKG60_06915 [Spirochaetota bacterium]|nr:hypothetical protein [Spirochaetota bacterium]HPS85911.1 hypothetical protein [Spirochaetota bacterium]
MPSDLESAANSLSEQTKKLQIALHYTFGDEEKAKKMLNGTYLDLYAVKGKFSSSSVYGAFIVFLNTSYIRVVNSYSLISRSFEISDIKTNQDWRNFEKQLVEISKKTGFDEAMTSKLRDSMNKALTIQEITKFAKLIEQDDGIAVNHNFQKFISDVTGFQNVELSVDYEKISSIAMELNSVTSTKISDAAESAKEKVAEDDIKIEKLDDPLEGKEVKLILNGALILSPIKGKEISELSIGDRIMISIIDKSPRAADLLKAFNAFRDDGSAKPIAGRIVSIKHLTDYKIFAIVAKGIYIKIVEEEDFIKVAMDPTYYNTQSSTDEADGKKNRMLMFILAGVFFVLVTIILLFVFTL